MYGLLHVKMARPNSNRENSMLFGFFLSIDSYLETHSKQI